MFGQFGRAYVPIWAGILMVGADGYDRFELPGRWGHPAHADASGNVEVDTSDVGGFFACEKHGGLRYVFRTAPSAQRDLLRDLSGHVI